MAYIALLTPAYIGHLNPMCVLARTLMRRRHRVVMIAPLDAHEKIRHAGVEFIPIAEQELPAGEWNRRTADLGELTGLAASRYVGRWLGDLTRGIVRDLPTIIERERFDGIVMDQICVGADAVCQVFNIPLAVACSALALNWESRVPPFNSHLPGGDSVLARLRNTFAFAIFNSTGFPVMRAVMPYRRQHNLGFMTMSHMNWMKPSLIQIAQQPAFLDFPRQKLPSNFHYTGPWKEESEAAPGEFPWERLDDRPLIYSSLGTLQNRLEYIFKIIAEACAGLDAQLVIGLGRKGAAIPEDFPGDPIIVGYAPQMALLKRASIVITHAGLNTSLEALAQGLPMVTIPITNDQPGVAARLQHLGVSQRVTLKELSIEKLRSAVCEVLKNPKYRETARTLAIQTKAIDGPTFAATLIEKAFTTRKLVERTPGNS